MAVLGTWLNHAWLRANGTKRLLVVEEAWMLVATAQMAALFDELRKFACGPDLSLSRSCTTCRTWQTAPSPRRC